MNETIVFDNSTVSFSIVPSSPVAFIDGGVQRYISRSLAYLTIDGSHSFDPDFLDAGALGYLLPRNALIFVYHYLKL